MWGLNASFLMKISKFVISASFGLPARDVGPELITSLPFLSISVCFFLYILSCRRTVLLFFYLFSERVVLYIVVVLVYS